MPWITQFCNLPENNWLVPIDKEWIGDWFYQYGIESQFDEFQLCIELITDSHLDPKWRILTDDKVKDLHIQATMIYGLMHARWITQPKGLMMMKKKYEAGVFGKCPRYLCKGTNLLPVGINFSLRKHRAKLFCPQCNDIYTSTNMVIDGAYFGSAFPHIFLSEYSYFDLSKKFSPYPFSCFGSMPNHLVHETNVHKSDTI